eukprot:SAG11_NODE_835_length_6927_cov_2.877142_4_plen_68_part_00
MSVSRQRSSVFCPAVSLRVYAKLYCEPHADVVCAAAVGLLEHPALAKYVTAMAESMIALSYAADPHS